MVQSAMMLPNTKVGRMDVTQTTANSTMEESDTRTSLAATQPGRVVLHETPGVPGKGET